MNFSQKKKIVSEIDENVLYADGFEDALIGYVTQFHKVLAVYDREKCLRILIQRDKMTQDEAEEFFSYNVEGAFVGEYTPCIFTRLT